MFRDEASGGEDSENEPSSELTHGSHRGRGAAVSSEKPDDSLTTRRSCRVRRSADFWTTVCKTVRPTLSDSCMSVCLSWVCLSVTLVYRGETEGFEPNNVLWAFHTIQPSSLWLF